MKTSPLYRPLAALALCLTLCGCFPSQPAVPKPSLDSADRQERLRAVDAAIKECGGDQKSGGKR
jgi:hypothetical protein